MTLIKKEDVQKILWDKLYIKECNDYTSWSNDWINSILSQIKSLPTHNHSDVLQKMIEDLYWIYWNLSEWWELKRTWKAMIWILEEAKKRITNHNNEWQNN